MTTIRIGRPPRRRSRRLTLIALAVVPVVTGATLLPVRRAGRPSTPHASGV